MTSDMSRYASRSATPSGIRATLLGYGLAGASVIAGVWLAELLHAASAARKSAEGSLRHARDDMERGVRERTAALEQANAQLHAEIAERRRGEEALRKKADLLHLIVADQGVGFDSSRLDVKPGLGFVSMRERLRLVQGTVHVHSAPAQGTTIDVWVPAPRQA